MTTAAAAIVDVLGIWYLRSICEYLSFEDVIQLASTCKKYRRDIFPWVVGHLVLDLSDDRVENYPYDIISPFSSGSWTSNYGPVWHIKSISEFNQSYSNDSYSCFFPILSNVGVVTILPPPCASPETEQFYDYFVQDVLGRCDPLKVRRVLSRIESNRDLGRIRFLNRRFAAAKFTITSPVQLPRTDRLELDLNTTKRLPLAEGVTIEVLGLKNANLNNRKLRLGFTKWAGKDSVSMLSLNRCRIDPSMIPSHIRELCVRHVIWEYADDGPEETVNVPLSLPNLGALRVDITSGKTMGDLFYMPNITELYVSSNIVPEDSSGDDADEEMAGVEVCSDFFEMVNQFRKLDYLRVENLSASQTATLLSKLNDPMNIQSLTLMSETSKDYDSFIALVGLARGATNLYLDTNGMGKSEIERIGHYAVENCPELAQLILATDFGERHPALNDGFNHIPAGNAWHM